MKKNAQLKIITVLFTILIASLIFFKIQSDKNERISAKLLNNPVLSSLPSMSNAEITKYIVYGTHFNIEGKIDIPKISKISITNVTLLMKNVQNETIPIDSSYTYKDSILTFSSIKEINTGINLDNLEIGNYYLFVKVTFSNNEETMYTFSNSTEYKSIDYYTITKDNKNNLVNIDFEKYKDTSYLRIKVSEAPELPTDVYDIVIDPGHGGSDLGAKSGGYTEANIVLDCALILKQQLEVQGYKVMLTRDESMSNTENTLYNMYDENGRVTIANKSHAKILISLHINGNSYTDSPSGGVEVLAPGNCDLSFAKSLADNIVTTAKTTYSTFKVYKKADGVYVHNYGDSEIESAKNSAKKNNYEPYNLNYNTPVSYILREIGGIITNAYMDGRNTKYETNKYLKSNVGIEGYSIDLGYMLVKKDLNHILENKELYMQAICDSISEYF